VVNYFKSLEYTTELLPLNQLANFISDMEGLLIKNQTVRLEVRFYFQTDWCARRDSNPEPSDP
jgi:hypothetical protein